MDDHHEQLHLRPARPTTTRSDEENDEIIQESIEAVGRQRNRRTPTFIITLWVLGFVFILATNLFSNIRIGDTLEETRAIAADTNEIVAYVAEIQSEEATSARDAQLQLLVQGVRSEIECDHRAAIQEMINELEAGGHIQLNAPVDVTCEGAG